MSTPTEPVEPTEPSEPPEPAFISRPLLSQVEYSALRADFVNLLEGIVHTFAEAPGAKAVKLVEVSRSLLAKWAPGHPAAVK